MLVFLQLEPSKNEIYTHVAPLGLDSMAANFFYTHIVPLGLKKFILIRYGLENFYQM